MKEWFSAFKEALSEMTVYWYLSILCLVLMLFSSNLTFDVAFWGLTILDMLERKVRTTTIIFMEEQEEEEDDISAK